jgi:hypothetical protein
VKAFPPTKLADLDRDSASTFLQLARISKDSPIVIYTGAGVGASAGLPSWPELIKRICSVFFVHWEYDIPSRRTDENKLPKQLSIALWESSFSTEQSRNLAEILSGDDPLLVAQQIKNCIRPIDWLYLLRKALYGEIEPRPSSELLSSISELCNALQGLIAIVSTSYDDLLDNALRDDGMRVRTVLPEHPYVGTSQLPVYHVHGFLGINGGPVSLPVLAEDDYYAKDSEHYSWCNVLQLSMLSQQSCLFIGHSMSDPRLRRFLRASHPCASGEHFAFLPSRKALSREHAMQEALFDSDLLTLGVRTVRYPIQPRSEDRHSRLPELIKLLALASEKPDTLWG